MSARSPVMQVQLRVDNPPSLHSRTPDFLANKSIEKLMATTSMELLALKQSKTVLREYR